MSTNSSLNKLQTQAINLSDQALSALPSLLQQKEFLRALPYNTSYGFGGLNLHRGWYCPSIISDIVIGNCSRGRIVTKPRSSKYSYKYFINHKNELCLIESFYQGQYVSCEYILHEENIVRGYTILPSNVIIRYSEELYVNGINSLYHYLDYNPTNNSPYNYHYESYSIHADKMLCEITDCYLDICQYDTRYYLFDLDSELTLKAYDYSRDNHFPSGSPKHTVHLHRKLNIKR